MKYQSNLDILEEMSKEAVEIFSMRREAGSVERRSEINKILGFYLITSDEIRKGETPILNIMERVKSELPGIRERIALLKTNPEPPLGNKEKKLVTKNPALVARDFLE